MQTTTPVWVTIAVGLLVLLGAWGSQIIIAVANLRTKRMELSYGRKADAYRDFVIKAGTFAHDPWNEEKYIQYLHSYLGALIVSSDDVKQALDGPTGVSVNAQRLRKDRDFDSMYKKQATIWYEAMEAATAAMRRDLQSLSGH